MDTFTHVLLGASVAQIPSHHDKNLELSFKTRACIGGLAGIIADIDYLLFFLNPLDFLAYWHRAETHSLILAPVWSILLTQLLCLWRQWKPYKRLLFFIIFYAMLSHSFIDSFTPYGTQWFAPLSDYRVSWNLLFVIDGYFLFTVTVCFFWLYKRSYSGQILLPFILPTLYLSLVALIKFSVEQTFSLRNSNQEHQFISYSLPQPLSPFYWQLVIQQGSTLQYAYVRLYPDPIGEQLSQYLNKPDYASHFQDKIPVQWRRAVLIPDAPALANQVKTVWESHKFKGFRDFAWLPVFLAHQQNEQETCIWFSDLRYHWPTFPPSFRYGMCLSEDSDWQVFRVPYFADFHNEKQIRRLVE